MKALVISPRRKSAIQAGRFGTSTFTIRRESISDVSYPASPMETVARGKISELTPERLLGPLNEVELKHAPPMLFTAGRMEIPLPRPRVAIVGSRDASAKGLDATTHIAGVLSRRGVLVVSGLARGIDTTAHKTTIEEGGRTIAVLGTPLNRTYPQDNSQLQKEIMTKHLAISQFPIGYPIQPRNFVLRNRTMALISNASIIVEAGERSGSLHQGWEALRLGRPLFIWKSVVNDTSLSWPKRMVRYGAMELADPKKVLDVLPSSKRISEIVLRV